MDFEKRRVILNLIEEVAESLPGQWDMKPFPDDWGRIGAWLTNPTTKAILAIGESQQLRDKNRLDVATDYPKDSKGNSAYEPRPKITVAAAKTGTQVANDIERRLFPEYLPILEKVLSRYTIHDEFESETTRIARKIAQIVKVTRDPESATVSFYHSPFKFFAETMSQAEAVGDNEVDLTLRLDAPVAFKVLNLLTTGRFEDPDI